MCKFMCVFLSKCNKMNIPLAYSKKFLYLCGRKGLRKGGFACTYDIIPGSAKRITYRPFPDVKRKNAQGVAHNILKQKRLLTLVCLSYWNVGSFSL